MRCEERARLAVKVEDADLVFRLASSHLRDTIYDCALEELQQRTQAATEAWDKLAKARITYCQHLKAHGCFSKDPDVRGARISEAA